MLLETPSNALAPASRYKKEFVGAKVERGIIPMSKLTVGRKIAQHKPCVTTLVANFIYMTKKLPVNFEFNFRMLGAVYFMHPKG